MPYSSKVPTQGIIRLSQLQEEFGGGNPIALSEYYKSISGNNLEDQFTTTGTTAWTVPAGVTQITFYGWGGGGCGGGNSPAGGPQTGQGGGGGAYTQKTFSVTPGETLLVTVGAAGGPWVSGSTKGPDGGDTYIVQGVSTVCTAGGGQGGSRSVAQNGRYGAGGIASGGDINYNGGLGQDGDEFSYTGWGANAAGPSGNGASGAQRQTGILAEAGSGSGGNINHPRNNANGSPPPGVPGGGGGGGNGGANGARGLAKIRYTPATNYRYVTDIGVNSGIPSSGQISLSNYYGTSKSITPAVITSYSVPGTYTYEVPGGVTSLDISALGGGASSATTTKAIPVTSGDLVSIQVGTNAGPSTVYPVTYPVYVQFLKDLGIWNDGMNGSIFDTTWNVYFPQSGTYTIEASADNAHVIYIDNNPVNAGSDWAVLVTTTQYVTQGVHSVRVYAEDWGMPASVAAAISIGGVGRIFTTRNPGGLGTSSSAAVNGRSVTGNAGFGNNNGQVTITAHGTATYTTSGVYTYTVPTGLTSVTINVTGAGGGGGGSDSGGPGAPGGAGTTVTGTLSVTSGDTITMYIGDGGNGGTSGNAGAFGSAGISYDPDGYAGGPGGGAGPGGWSGGGAGGGAATTLWKNASRIVVAAGGGGGGGGSWNRAGNGPNNGGGAPVGNQGAAGNPAGGDGGGGGGGGGGVVGGYGGSAGQDNSVGGYSGSSGTSLVPTDWTSITGSNGAPTAGANGGDGRVTISF